MRDGACADELRGGAVGHGAAATADSRRGNRQGRHGAAARRPPMTMVVMVVMMTMMIVLAMWVKEWTAKRAAQRGSEASAAAATPAAAAAMLVVMRAAVMVGRLGVGRTSAVRGGDHVSSCNGGGVVRIMTVTRARVGPMLSGLVVVICISCINSGWRGRDTSS